MTAPARQVEAVELLLTGTAGPLLRFAGTLIAELAKSVGRAAPLLRNYDPAVEDQAVVDAIRDNELVAVVVIDDPMSCLRSLVSAGHTPVEAARVLTAAAASLAGWAHWRVVRLRPDMTVGEATDVILNGMGLPAGTPFIAGADSSSAASLASLAATNADTTAEPPDRLAEMQALADQVIAPMFAAVATGVSCAVTWSRACLFWGDHPGEKLPRIIDLTGPARVLAYGPYFHLPPGNWTVRATLAFSPGAIGEPFAVELHGGGFLGRARFRPMAAGVFAASFPVRVRSAYAANEIRVVNEKGAIAGEIGVDHFRLIPQGQSVIA